VYNRAGECLGPISTGKALAKIPSMVGELITIEYLYDWRVFLETNTNLTYSKSSNK
jgi:hypothetical protein